MEKCKCIEVPGEKYVITTYCEVHDLLKKENPNMVGLKMFIEEKYRR